MQRPLDDDPPARWLPAGVRVLLGYRRAWWRGDVVAGITVAAYLVPQVMAYSTVAGLPQSTGLWAAVIALPVYAVFGSSRKLSIGPESTTALMTASVLAPLAVGDPARYAGLAATLSLVVGAVCLLAWALRLGVVAELLSRPVLVGYLAGVAVIMMVSQLRTVTGVPAHGDGSPIGDATAVLSRLDAVQPATALLAAGVLAALVVGTRLLPRAPVPLLVVAAAAALVAALGNGSVGLAVVGTLPPGGPLPAVPPLGLGDLRDLLLPALGIAVVGYTDTVLTARSFDEPGEAADPGSELLALGAVNVAAGIVPTFPLSSSGSRTAIAHSLGARTQVYSLVAAGTVLLVVLAGRDLLVTFPRAALGALVIWAATKLVDVGEFRRLARFRTSELFLALATTVGVLTLDILVGVLVAVGLSALDVLRRVARPHSAVLGFVPGLAGMHNVEHHPDSEQIAGLVVFRYDSPLFFANAADFLRDALAAVDAADPEPEWLLINAEAVVQLDLTSADAVGELHDALAERGVVLAFARLTTEARELLRRAGVLERIGEDHIHPTLPVAVDAYRRRARSG